ncbi:MAG: aminoglycoside phosphotransferase family protein [Kofleriaceae bacterium]|nr:aminoglycoside phosphotransferase family protein [Kofleriaceae bacterium]
MNDPRIYPLIEVSREQIAKLAGGPVRRIERIDGGLTNTLHKVERHDGKSFAVKHYAAGIDAFGAELATLTLLHGTLPVPDVVYADEKERVIVYRWIEGITLHDLRKTGSHTGFGSLADPLGRLLAWLARTDATEAFELTHILERAYRQLTGGRARERLGAPIADALRKGLEIAEPTLGFGTVCLAHGDLSGRNVIVERAAQDSWRINGVIDWETTSTGSPLVDIGSLFRHADQFDPAWCEAFATGYREADGNLPDNWLVSARLLDATLIIDILDEPREIPGVFAENRKVLARLASELAR